LQICSMPAAIVSRHFEYMIFKSDACKVHLDTDLTTAIGQDERA